MNHDARDPSRLRGDSGRLAHHGSSQRRWDRPGWIRRRHGNPVLALAIDARRREPELRLRQRKKKTQTVAVSVSLALSVFKGKKKKKKNEKRVEQVQRS